MERIILHHSQITVLTCYCGRRKATASTGYRISKITINTGNTQKVAELKNVLWVPGLNSNLISVNCLGKKGHTVTFTGQECFITTKGKVTNVGKSFNGMYKLDHVKTHRALTTQSVPKQFCIHEWHRKLAHRNLDDIKRQLKNDNTSIKKCNHNDDCKDCLIGKMSRKPFHQAQPIEHPLDVIVSDVCGPLPVESVDKKRYFATFTDAYSKFTETFFMREKSDVTRIAIDYLEKLHTQHGTWPKTFRSDRGKEYINDRFQRYLTRRGIKAEFTVGYAPEQNGIAERKKTRRQSREGEISRLR